jgi:hypothetical protein
MVPCQTSKLKGGSFWLMMSALGHKRTFCDARAMSALSAKADISEVIL